MNYYTDYHEIINQLQLTHPNAVLVAVSKSFDIQSIIELYNCGQRDFGENYLKELRLKQQQLISANNQYQINWHFLGKLQSAKLKLIAQNCNWVHTLTKISHADKLNCFADSNKPLNVLVQINISQEDSKSGINIFQVEEICILLEYVRSLNNLKLRGLMGIAHRNNTSTQIIAEFNQLAQLYQQYQYLGLDTLSMGMSDDYKIALSCGSNMLRIGRKIFGNRS